jgi:hypothetical protein
MPPVTCESRDSRVARARAPRPRAPGRPAPSGGCCWSRGAGGDACVTKSGLFFAEEVASAVACYSMQEYGIYVDTCGEGTTYFLLRTNE